MRSPLPAGHAGFVAPDQRYDCAQCIAWHAGHFRFPPLPARYHEAWRLWMLLSDQQRVGMEPIGLDYGVLPTVFDFQGIVDPDDRRRLFEELVVLNHAMATYRGEQAEERRREHERERASVRARGGRRG